MLVLSSVSAFSQEVTILDKLIKQKNYELVWNKDTGLTPSYPCPTRLEVEQDRRNPARVLFNYAKGSNEKRDPINTEFVSLLTNNLNTGEKVERYYDSEDDTIVKERDLTKGTENYFYKRNQVTYKAGLLLSALAVRLPFQFYLNIVSEVELNETSDGFQLIKRETDHLNKEESFERVCLYKH